jgi:hypothetical protein
MEEAKTKNLNNEEIKDLEVYSLNFLINTILDYYLEAGAEEEPGEEWKRGTVHQSSNRIPEDLDSVVKQAFKSQLKKFIK